MKKYLDKTVYEAFCERINYIFDEFECVCLSFSGGKDSSVMLQLTNELARVINRKFDVFHIDLEAGYKMTYRHIEELKDLSQINQFYHFCLPITEHNGLSVFRPSWTVWNPEETHLWVREMPKDAITMENIDPGLFKKGDEWEELLKRFPVWLRERYGTNKVACLLGLRADESMNRFRSVAFAKNMYKDKNWSTKMRKGVYNFSPLYDWRTEDIWTAVARFDLRFNEAYELMYKNGLSIHDQRICQPFGQDQRASLNQFSLIEPDTWVKIVNRVSGVNFGNIYCKTTLLGHNGSEKPDHMTWKQYAVFLLETIRMYAPELAKHYVRKINILFDYIKEQEGLDKKDIQEVHRPGRHESEKSWISWKRIARTIEKNDFECRGLSYGLTNTDRQVMIDLKEKWGNLLGIEKHQTKPMKKLAKEIGYETD